MSDNQRELFVFMAKQIISLVVRCIKTLLRKFVFRCFSQQADQIINLGRKPNTIRLRENTETFKKIYATFEEVSERTSYDSPESLMTGRSRVLEHELRARANTTELLPADPRCQIDNLIALLIAAKPMTGRFTVLNYSGGIGASF